MNGLMDERMKGKGMWKIEEAILSIFYPRCCPMCGVYVGQEDGKLCKQCLADLPRTEQAEVRQNLTEMILAGPTEYTAASLKAMHVERAAAYLFYEKDHPIQRLIHRIKYADQPMVGYQLGREAAMEMGCADFFDEIDVIVPIPLHPKRFRERGYNQSEFIARGISDVTGIPVDTTHVTRVKNTPQQALQVGDERRRNVSNAFAVNHPEQMYEKHILVVDDLITTGETMRSCLKAMKRFRKAKFSVFALCKAR